MDHRGYRRGELLRLFSFIYPIMSLRFLYYGFIYFRQLDDYIQYFNYEHFGGTRLALIRRLGLLAARPLAGLADLFIWSKTYANMIIAVLILTAMHAAAAVLLFLMFRRHLGVSSLFLAVFCLIPTGFEGTYWVSASSRILCGLFFAVVAAWFLQRFSDSGRWHHILLFAVLQLVSFGFYEQALFLSFALTLVITLLNAKDLGRKALWSFLWFPNVCTYMGFTSLFKDSSLYAQRIQPALPNTRHYFRVFLPEVLQQLKSAFLGGGFFITWRGFFRGWAIILLDRAWLYLLLVLCAAGAFFLYSHGKEPPAGRRGPTSLALGVVLAAAPVLPFFFLGNPWFSIRNTVMSFAGIALIVDALVAILSGFVGRRGAVLRSIVTSAAVIVFLTASVAELHDYRATTENDVAIVQRLRSAIGDSAVDKRIAVLNLNPSYLSEQSYFYHEHIHGVTESEWALTGALQAIGKSPSVPSVTPIASTMPIYRSYDRFEDYDLCYLFDGNGDFVPLRRDSLGDDLFDYYDMDGNLRAQIRRDQRGTRVLRVQGD